MTTIIDVAKEAQVSKSTVSRVISGNGYVSETSRKKILAAMEKLAYTPNNIARNLQSGETRTIGIIAHGHFDMFGVALERFITVARKYEYFVTLFFTDGDKEKELRALDQLKYKQLDGLFIFTRANEWPIIEAYSIYGPIATWHRIDSPHIYSSYIDHYSGYFHSLLLLKKRGYSQIGHVLGNQKNLNTQARMQAIQDFYQENQLKLNPDWLFHALSGTSGGRTIAKNWQLLDKKPEAMAFYSDATAAEFISQLQLLGYSVPEDIAIIGFDNSEMSQLMHITTVDYSLKHQTENAFIYIHNQLNKKTLPYKEMQIQLIDRKTVPNKYKN